ncbi:aminoglycoside phosphotransferase (APT) family kinase protein [Rhodococcus sp. SMB37]|uniref:phosphotransferase family protein n=1 Tax=Rhodococcus sp. SMB37 TaxID=2512213 RepID=UPI0006CF96A4|nr:phosphotransferase family protein [Rhodococcus sp. SMB37]TCN45881.1 aminoglycoside phosphotransferase (APT) family kinase protein [Rhodococcus sp. SMB37]
MSELPDNARVVRDEDTFDVRAVATWLGEHAGIAGIPEVRQFSGGASNLTYLLRYPDRDLVLRRPPAGAKPSSGHDMAREYRIQSLLAPAYPHVPAMVGMCTDHSVLGSDFYVMERVPGTILRTDPPTTLDLTPEQTRALCLRIVDLLVELHGVDPETSGLNEFSRGTGYVARQVAGWTKRYAKVRTDNVPDFARVTRWLDETQPADVASTVVHGDFRLDNVVLDADDPLRPVAVLDWELATIGDPLMDLGSSLAYWVQADDDPMMLATKRQPSDLPGMLTRREIVEYYSKKSGMPVDDWGFYEVFGLFRLAVIAQQIYYRYHHGHTTNPAFKDFWVVVGYLDSRCNELIDQLEKEGR